MNNLPARLIIPFGIWFIHFSTVYGAHAVLCSAGDDGRRHWIVIIAATVLAVVALLALLANALRSTTRDRVAAIAATGLALLAVIWTTVPAALLTACQ